MWFSWIIPGLDNFIRSQKEEVETETAEQKITKRIERDRTTEIERGVVHSLKCSFGMFMDDHGVGL